MMTANKALRLLATPLALAAALGGCAQVGKTISQATDRSQIVAQPACMSFNFPIYFETGSDRLTREALQLINDSAAQIRACKVAEVQVTGLADADGSAERNMELSRQRALAVTKALSARGYPTPTFDINAAGAAGATTGSGMAPLRRRAEVNVRFASPTPTTAPSR